MKRKITGEEYNELSEELQKLYKKEGDGNYYLQIEGESEELKAERQKLKEFRNNNVTLQKRLEEFEKKYKNIDPEKYEELQQRMQDMDDKKLLEEGEIDKLVEQKTERMRKDYEARIEALSKDNDRLSRELGEKTEHLSKVVIESRIVDSVNEVGMPRKGAMKDIINRGREVWKLGDDGEPLAQKSDGSPLYGKDPKQPLSFKEWAEGLIVDAPYLFEPSEGLQSKGGDKNIRSKGLGAEMKDLPAVDRLRELHKGTTQGKSATG